MRREVAEYINGILDQDDPDILESAGNSRISQLILNGGIRPMEVEKEEVVDTSRAQLSDVVAFRK